MTGSWEPGQLVWAGFPGLEIPSYLAAAIARGRIGGVALFRRNIVDPEQLRALVGDLHALAPASTPLLISMDQEGGRVARLRAPWTVWPPMRDVGRLDDLELTRAIGAAHARELRDVGARLNFAPVADVDSNPANPVIGDRSFGSDPTVVARHVCAYVEGIQTEGVAACVKHFPGHGDTDLDSHLALPTLRHSRQRLDAIELLPFRAASQAKAASIMTAHVIFAAIDAVRPATMSPDVLAILRDELRYEGLVITDDLEMKAVANHFALEDRILGPLRAGCDVLLACSQQDLQEEAVRRLERAPDALLEGPLQRLSAFKQKWAAGNGKLPRAVRGSQGGVHVQEGGEADELAKRATARTDRVDERVSSFISRGGDDSQSQPPVLDHRAKVQSLMERTQTTTASGLILPDPTEAEAIIAMVRIEAANGQAPQRGVSGPSRVRTATGADSVGARGETAEPPYVEHQALAQRVLDAVDSRRS